MLSLSQLVDGAREIVEAASPSDARDQLRAYLLRVEEVVPFRNDYAHNLWPAQASQDLLGWRPVRSKTVTKGEAQFVSKDPDAVRTDLRNLVQVLVDWPRYYGLVSVRPGLPNSKGTAPKR